MSKAPDAPDLDFPDVRTGPRAALLLTALSALVYAIVFWVSSSAATGDSLELYASFGLGGALLLLAFIDMRTGLLLDWLTLPLLVAGILNALIGPLEWWNAALGALIGYALIAGLAFYWRKSRGYEGIGLGDAKLLAAGGAWVGATLLPVVLLIASGLGIILALTVSQKPRQADVRIAIPFGPGLCFGIWAAWCLKDFAPYI